jgi:hypothetical protein
MKRFKHCMSSKDAKKVREFCKGGIPPLRIRLVQNEVEGRAPKVSREDHMVGNMAYHPTKGFRKISYPNMYKLEDRLTLLTARSKKIGAKVRGA